MKTKREEKLADELKKTRIALHKEKQKTHDLQTGRNIHKTKNKDLKQTVKEQVREF
jgi:Tfp pilus assembly protein PilN